MNEWKDISSAPKDGRPLLVHDAEWGRVVAKCDAGACAGSAGSPPWLAVPPFTRLNPTKWQPLPPSPPKEPR